MDADARIPTRPDKKWILAFCLLSCCLLLAGSVACNQSEQQGDTGGKNENPLFRVYKFTSDTSHYFSTSHEGKFVTHTDYLYKPNLENIPLNLGSWEGEDLETNDTNILYQRYYWNEEREVEIYLVAVHGTHESQFHTPEVCYIGDGWKIKERQFKSIDLKGETFQVRYAIAKKGDTEHLVLYWYLWPNSRRNITDGMAMFRLSVNIYSSTEKAEQAALDFIQELSDLKLDLNNNKVAELITPVLPRVTKSKKITLTEWTAHKEKAIAWLKSQAVPNHIVPEPAQDRRHLLISYRVPKDSDDYRYVFSKASLYDNALAIIVFSMVGEFSLAEKTIEAASRVVSPDGDLWFTFNTHNSWPSDGDHVGAIVRSGTSAWLGYAITYYLKSRLVENPNLFQQDNEAVNHLKTAQSIADRILLRQVTDPADPRNGFFTGGEGRYSYRWNKELEDIEEYFIPGSVQWASVEHNIDIYFFLRDLARLSGERNYESAAQLLKQSIVEKSWNEKIGQLNRGQRLDGVDPVKALDCASWGTMFLLAIGEEEKAAASLQSVANYHVRSGAHQGYKPYIDLLLYEGREINKLFFPDNPEKNWNDVPMIWPEGSLGVAMAYIKMGKRKQARELVASILKLQDEEGGVPYATEHIRFQFSDNPSVAGTAWLVMVISALEDDSILQLFWER